MQLSDKEWKRLDVLERVRKRELQVTEAAQILGITERQLWNLRRAIIDKGSGGVRHRLKGRSPSNRTSEKVRKRVVELFKDKYAGFNDTHFTEKLVEVEGIGISRPTVQRILRGSALWAVRQRRPSKHRQRRERKAQEGAMLLWDGSPHDWLEGRGPVLCLMGAIDDATGNLMPGAHFVAHECSSGYLRVLLGVTRAKGLPCSIYMDQHSSLKRNDDYWTIDEELAGKQAPTQVGRALEELGITPIFALSAQAKGRVERLWGTLQDRLVSELRLVGAKTMEEANAVLTQYIDIHNRKFGKAPKDMASLWRKIRNLDLEKACAFAYQATVDNDNAVRKGGNIIDIPPGPCRRSYAKARVDLRQLLDGSWRVYYNDTLIAQSAATAVAEVKALPQKKRGKVSRLIRKTIEQVQPTASEMKPATKPKPTRRSAPPPFNAYTRRPRKSDVKIKAKGSIMTKPSPSTQHQ
jgi:hypothetical protein